MLQPTARTHDLHGVFFHYIFIAHAVDMVHLSFQHNRNDFHVHVRMDTKSFSNLQKIVIEGEQGPEGGAHRVIVVAEAEEEITLKPTYIFGASFGCRKTLYAHVI